MHQSCTDLLKLLTSHAVYMLPNHMHSHSNYQPQQLQWWQISSGEPWIKKTVWSPPPILFNQKDKQRCGIHDLTSTGPMISLWGVQSTLGRAECWEMNKKRDRIICGTDRSCVISKEADIGHIFGRKFSSPECVRRCFEALLLFQSIPVVGDGLWLKCYICLAIVEP